METSQISRAGPRKGAPHAGARSAPKAEQTERAARQAKRDARLAELLSQALQSKTTADKERRDKLLLIDAVVARCGLGTSSLYAAMAIGTFPKSVAIGSRRVAWNEWAIDAWSEAVEQLSREPL